MTEYQDDNSEERLREILRAEVDRVQPSGDGLQLIRERTAKSGISWLTWLRPAAAVAASLAIVGTVLMSAPTIREQIIPTTFQEQADPAPPPEPTREDTAPPDTSVEADPPEEGGTQPDGQEPDPPRGEQPDQDNATTDMSATQSDKCPPVEDDPTVAAAPDEPEGVPEHCKSDSDGDEPPPDDDPSDPDTGEPTDPTEPQSSESE